MRLAPVLPALAALLFAFRCPIAAAPIGQADQEEGEVLEPPGAPDSAAAPSFRPRVPDPASAATPKPDSARPIRNRPHSRFKSDLILVAPSVVLPGFGQYFQGEGRNGLAYTGVAFIGYGAAVDALNRAEDEGLDPHFVDDASHALTAESWIYREYVLGALAAQGSGFLSAYSAFRSSVPRFQDEDGKYLFLEKEETVGDLLVSPFRLSHLAKPSTYVPLGLLAGAVGYMVADARGSHRGADWTLSGDDFLFTGAESYNAGVTEEALFRGWLYPVAYQYMGRSFWWANAAQAVLFGAAHYDSHANPVPWPQAVIGFYLGWLTERDHWSLSQSIFTHAWWDMILFAGEVATTYRGSAGTASLRVDLPIPL